jgi:hypothetical protein
MRHLQLFEDFSSQVNEGAIPVYNEADFKRNLNAAPVQEIKYSQVIATLRDLLAKKDIKEITVIADIPSQGKGAPDYVKDIIAKERERVAQRYKASIGKSMDSDDDDEFDFDIDRFGNQRTIFFDSEFIVDRVEEIGGKTFVIGIPASLKNMGYEAKISPEKVEEIYYSPA